MDYFMVGGGGGVFVCLKPSVSGERGGTRRVRCTYVSEEYIPYIAISYPSY